jgi:hypothetical protein
MNNERDILISKLIDENVFWSYQKPDYSSLSDEVIISNVILYLDSEEIDLLFKIFDSDSIKNSWIKDIISLDHYYSLNRLIAFVYFGINNPDEFIENNRIQLA